MRYRPLGESGIQASVVALGTWAMGGWRWGGTDESAAMDGVRAAVDAGVNLIDTAPVYGYGLSESIVGRAIRGIREKVLIATKCGLVWHEAGGEFHFAADDKGMNKEGPVKVYRWLRPAAIREDLERSLRRLETDHVDLYQTHWQDSTTPVEETMDCLLALKKEGKIRAIGACNATVGHMERYRARGPLDCDQERYSMLDRKLEADQLPWCRKNNVAVLAYSPLENGLLTGKIPLDRVFKPGDLRRDKPLFSPAGLMKVRSMLDAFEPIARRRGASTAQLVVAWTVAQPGVTHALVGARNAKQALENAAAGDLELSPQDLEEIGRILGDRAPALKA